MSGESENESLLVEFGAASASSGVLSGDGVPADNQSLRCFSCNAPVSQLYCGACGQKNDDYRRPLWRLGTEAIASLTALEGRIWRTWWRLLSRPGDVARRYADGERTRWSSPVRVYLFMSILLFGYMEWTDTQFVAIDIDVDAQSEEIDVEPLFFVREATLNAINADKDFALIERALSQGSFDIDIGYGGVGTDDDMSEAVSDEGVRSSQDEPSHIRKRVRATGASSGNDPSEGSDVVPNFDSDVPGLRINGQTVERSRGASLLADFARNPTVVNATLNRWVPRVIFLMLPVSMLLGAVFIRGRRRRGLFRQRDLVSRPALLYDHAVHAAYLHAVAYLCLFLGVLGAHLFDTGRVAEVLFIGLLAYLPLSLRRMFRRGWIKTLWTSYAMGFLYVLIVTGVLVALIAVGVQEALTG